MMMLVNKTFALLHVSHCCVCGDISDDACRQDHHFATRFSLLCVCGDISDDACKQDRRFATRCSLLCVWRHF